MVAFGQSKTPADLLSFTFSAVASHAVAIGAIASHMHIHPVRYFPNGAPGGAGGGGAGGGRGGGRGGPGVSSAAVFSCDLWLDILAEIAGVST